MICKWYTKMIFFLLVTIMIVSCQSLKKEEYRLIPLTREQADKLWNMSTSQTPVGEKVIERYDYSVGDSIFVNTVTTSQVYVLELKAPSGGSGSLSLSVTCIATCSSKTGLGCSVFGCDPDGSSCTATQCLGTPEQCAASCMKISTAFGSFLGQFIQ